MGFSRGSPPTRNKRPLVPVERRPGVKCPSYKCFRLPPPDFNSAAPYCKKKTPLRHSPTPAPPSLCAPGHPRPRRLRGRAPQPPSPSPRSRAPRPPSPRSRAPAHDLAVSCAHRPQRPLRPVPSPFLFSTHDISNLSLPAWRRRRRRLPSGRSCALALLHPSHGGLCQFEVKPTP